MKRSHEVRTCRSHAKFRTDASNLPDGHIRVRGGCDRISVTALSDDSRNPISSCPGFPAAGAGKNQKISRMVDDFDLGGVRTPGFVNSD
jgi:hypothetical protein